jgi:tRNA (cmo5U34)-methyltransferase
MRAHLQPVLQPFADRVTIDSFRLEDREWRRALPSNVRCVLASLVIHHLPGDGKRQLFRDLAATIQPDGVLLIADLVEPANGRVAEHFAKEWDTIVRQQSLDQLGNLSADTFFRDEHWNYYAYPDPFDQPSRLVGQLDWLRAAGFSDVDCSWLRAGHAIFGGYR